VGLSQARLHITIARFQGVYPFQALDGQHPISLPIRQPGHVLGRQLAGARHRRVVRPQQEGAVEHTQRLGDPVLLHQLQAALVEGIEQHAVHLVAAVVGIDGDQPVGSGKDGRPVATLVRLRHLMQIGGAHLVLQLRGRLGAPFEALLSHVQRLPSRLQAGVELQRQPKLGHGQLVFLTGQVLAAALIVLPGSIAYCLLAVAQPHMHRPGAQADHHQQRHPCQNENGNGASAPFPLLLLEPVATGLDGRARPNRRRHRHLLAATRAEQRPAAYRFTTGRAVHPHSPR